MITISFDGSCPSLLKLVSQDFYTGKFVPRKFRSVDHIVPRSKKGKSKLFNYAMTDKKINEAKSNLDLLDFIKRFPEYKENMKQYVLKYWDIKIGRTKNYGQALYETVKKEGLDLIA